MITVHDLCQAKITYTGVICFVEQDISGFDVPVNDVLCVDKIQGSGNFTDPALELYRRHTICAVNG